MANLDYMRSVIRGIVSDNKTNLFFAKEKLEPEHFHGDYEILWRLIVNVSDITGGCVLDKPTLNKILDSRTDISMDRKAALVEVWDSIVEIPEVSQTDFKFSVHSLINEYKIQYLGMALANTGEILTGSVKEGKDTLSGVDDAVTSIRKSLGELDKMSLEDLPEGYISTLSSKLIDELYAEGGNLNRIKTGIKALDELTIGGIGLGELWLVAAYAGVGKTTLCANIAYHAFVSGYNVVYLTAETLLDEVLHKIAVRHSRFDKFDIPGGISSEQVKKHTMESPQLSVELQNKWTEVADDLSSSEYGKLFISQIPMNAKLSYIHSKLDKINSENQVDLVIVDSLDLLSAETRRPTNRDELNDILATAKKLAVAFDNGRGLRLITPWQTSRSAYTDSLDSGGYDKTAMAETSEAERKADLILGLTEKKNTNRIRAQLVKFRAGRQSEFTLIANYDKCYVASESGPDLSLETQLTLDG
jgi:replicative DNA helicase